MTVNFFFVGTKIISIANNKGGTGKTSTCASLAFALRENGHRILLIDIDPQGSLTDHFGIDPDSLEKEETLYGALFKEGLTLEHVILKVREGIDLVPANRHLTAAEALLFSEPAGETYLSSTLKSLNRRYEFILIDCPPGLGMLTYNALVASHSVLIPVECSYPGLRGLKNFLGVVDFVKERLNQNLEIEGILPVKFDRRTIHSRQAFERLKEAFPDKVFSVVIPHTVKIPEANTLKETILEYLPTHKASVAFRELAREVINHAQKS